jgi:two-component sensor histidine kinase
MLLAYNHKKDLLYNEVHHRVKNNLNIISSMLAIQAETESTKIKKIVNISKERIDAIALVHNMLYISNDIEKINVYNFIKKLCSNLKKTTHKNINIMLKIKELELSLNEIIPLGLIINELFTNSLKHAFKTTLNPRIIIVLKLQKNNIMLTYFDNGIGCNQQCKKNIGLKLVNLNIKQLKGSLKIIHNNGLLYKINCKRVKYV